MIRFSCPKCKTVLECPELQAGENISCPKCQQRMKVPGPPRDKTVLAALVPETVPQPRAVPVHPLAMPAPGQALKYDQAPTKKGRKLLLLAISGVALVAALVTAVVLFWQTPQGTVRIESDDPNVVIVFDKSGPTIRGADQAPIALPTGEHGLDVKRGDLTIETEKILIKKGETITLKIELLPGKTQVVANGRVIGERTLPGSGVAVAPEGGSQPAKLPDVVADATVPAKSDETLLTFDSLQTRWYDDDPMYFKEYEQYSPGYYDFHFKNVAGKELALGVKSVICDCSSTKIALFPKASTSVPDDAMLDWKTINPVARPEDDKESEPGVTQVSIPPLAQGIIRISWNSRKAPKKELFKEPGFAAKGITYWLQEPLLLVLGATLWVQPTDRSTEKVEEKLSCRMAITAPVMFMPAKVDVGDVRSPITAKFIGWSVTRSDLKVEELLDPDPKARDARFDYKIGPVPAGDRAKIEGKLKEMKRNKSEGYLSYRVKSAFYLDVTIYPEKGGKFLNLGHDRHVPKLLLDGVTPFDGPMIELLGPGPGKGGSVNPGEKSANPDNASTYQPVGRDVLPIELVTADQYKGSGKWYLIDRKEPPVKLSDVNDFLKDNKNYTSVDIVITPKSPDEFSGAVVSLRDLIDKKYKLPTRLVETK